MCVRKRTGYLVPSLLRACGVSQKGFVEGVHLIPRPLAVFVALLFLRQLPTVPSVCACAPGHGSVSVRVTARSWAKMGEDGPRRAQCPDTHAGTHTHAAAELGRNGVLQTYFYRNPAAHVTAQPAHSTARGARHVGTVDGKHMSTSCGAGSTRKAQPAAAGPRAPS